MALHKINYLSQSEVKMIANDILKDAFGAYGYAGDTCLHVEEVEDFDGSDIFRINAFVNESVPTDTLITANDHILLALRQRGENRFVILTTTQPGSDDMPNEDID